MGRRRARGDEIRLHQTPDRTHRQRKSHRHRRPRPSQFEHDAIADAIEISGLRTPAINDGTAIAVNYAITRTFRTSEYPAIYDAGSSGIRATVASFTTAKGPKTGAAGTRIVVAGAGTTGGVELDRRMREILVDAFNAKRGKDTWEKKRVVESLAWDIDLKTKVTRA